MFGTQLEINSFSYIFDASQGAQFRNDTTNHEGIQMLNLSFKKQPVTNWNTFLNTRLKYVLVYSALRVKLKIAEGTPSTNWGHLQYIKLC